MSALYRLKGDGLEYEAYRIGNIGFTTPEWVNWAIDFGLLRFDEDAEGRTVALIREPGRVFAETAKTGDYLVYEGGMIYAYEQKVFSELFVPVVPEPGNMKTVTLNEEGNDHVESLQAEARQADEAASGEDGVEEDFYGLAGYNYDRILNRRIRALEMAVDVYRARLDVGVAIEAGKAALANIRAQREERAVYRRQRALELAVDVYRTGTAIGHADITTLAREFDLFLAGKEADHEA